MPLNRYSTLLALMTTLACGLAPASQRLFDYQSTTLENGLEVVTLEDFSTPIVAVGVWYHVGAKDERPDRQGFAHMFEHMMFRGTDLLEPKEHADLVQSVGGNANAGTSFDYTVYYQTLPANQLDLALWLESERMAFLEVNQENYDVERKVVEEELRVMRDGPYGTLFDQVLAELFGEYAYGWTPGGQIKHLRAAPVQELRDFWERYYVPNNAMLLVVGAAKHQDVVAKAKKYFGWITRGPEPERPYAVAPEATQARHVTLKEKNAPTTILGEIYRTVPKRHADTAALSLLATILGGGESSRLYRDLVADTQAVAVSMAFAESMEVDGVFGLGAVMSPMGGKSEDHIRERFAHHIERLQNELVTPRELTKAKNQMLKQVVASQLTVSSKGMTLGRTWIEHGSVAPVNEQLDAIRRVTAADLQRVARQYLRPERAMQATAPQNILGALFSRGGTDEGEVTAEPETEAPPPGRPGLQRPDDYPRKPPLADLGDYKIDIDKAEQTLDNGLRVIVVPNHEVEFVTLRLGVLNGAYTEEKPGVASMAASMLTKGTTQHTEAELTEELETYAISLAGSADIDDASVSANALTEHTPRAFGFLAEVVQHPTFPEEELEKLRQQMRTALAIEEASPEVKAERAFRQVLWGDHPYARVARPETLDDLEAITAEDLKAWWSTFVRPEDSVLIVAGDIKPEQAFSLARQHLADWTVTTQKPEVDLPAPPEPSKQRIYLVNHPGKQSQIRIGHRGITRHHPDYFDALMVNGYFAGGFSGRLMETVRQEKGLTYGVSGGFRAQRFGGEFRVSTFTQTDRTVEAVQAIFAEIKRLEEEPPSNDELSLFRSYVLGSFVGRRETPQQVAGDIWLQISQQLPANYFDQLLSEIADATAVGCVSLVEETVHPDRMAVIIVGDAGKLKDALAEIAPVVMIEPGQNAGLAARSSNGAS